LCGDGASGRASGRGILAVEHDVIPLDGADVFQQGEIDSVGDRVAPAESEGFPAADASAGPQYGDSTSQRRGTERGSLAYKIT
jgi:hypothetical protein